MGVQVCFECGEAIVVDRVVAFVQRRAQPRRGDGKGFGYLKSIVSSPRSMIARAARKKSIPRMPPISKP
jgi:hypothetical protein